MKRVFADTAFFVGLLNQRDQAHALANHLLAVHVGQMLTTTWVLLELANYCAAAPYRQVWPVPMNLQHRS